MQLTYSLHLRSFLRAGLLFIGLLLSVFSTQAQFFDYGNNWYVSNPNQTFIKLIVEEDGIYRVSRQDLLTAGFDLSAVNPANLQLIYRGEQIPIYVSATGGQLDYLEFFGRHNDGVLDSVMYRDPIRGTHSPEAQTNKNWSLFSDESTYFLTWSSFPGQRIFPLFDPTYQLYTPVSSFIYETRLDYQNGSYNRGGGDGFSEFYYLNSDYITGEGHMGPPFRYGNTGASTLTFETPAQATNNNVTVTTRVFGQSSRPHRVRLSLDGNTTSPVLDTSLSAQIYLKTYERDVNVNLSNETDLTFEALAGVSDNNLIAWAKLTYERAPDAAGDSSFFIKNWDASSKTYLRLTNLRGSDTLFVYDPVNRVRNTGLINNGVGQVLVQGFPNTRDLYLATDADIKSPRIESSNLNRLSEGTEEFVIITHRALQASAEAYAQYRDTATVTELNGVRIAYVDEIYDEFGYGSPTPWAIKRFCKYALDNWASPPKYFLLWGKGLFNLRSGTSLPIVPTFGYPSTDYEFIGHFDQNSPAVDPEASIGRVNITGDQDGFAYLNKVIDYEQSPWEAWMKRGVFLGGGNSAGEQSDIESAFQFALDIYEGAPFGGTSFYFQKRDNDVIIDPTKATYHNRISEGVNIIHFFGHSTRNILDISIRDADEYTNFGRYPFVVAMGCYGGDFSTASGASFGESWVTTPERGAIGYLANSSAGYLYPLRDYSRVLYRFMYDEMLGEPIGDVIRATLDQITDSIPVVQIRNHGRQMNLQGDPAVRIKFPEKPDLAIDETSVIFEPELFTAQDDSFTIKVIINNLGLVTSDSFTLRIDQYIPDGRIFEQVNERLPVVTFIDTVEYVLQNPAGNQITGLNTFDIFVDADREIDEYDETNNRISFRQNVPGNIPAILFPPEFAIIPDNEVELRASAFFITQDAGTEFIFEIDTTNEFNSPAKLVSGTVTGTSALASWVVPSTLTDSTVYFWRVRLANVQPASWAVSSFKYIAGRTGWAQAKFPQFYKNAADRLEREALQQEWSFQNFGMEYEFKVNQSNGWFQDSRNGNLESTPETYGFSRNLVAIGYRPVYPA